MDAHGGSNRPSVRSREARDNGKSKWGKTRKERERETKKREGELSETKDQTHLIRKIIVRAGKGNLLVPRDKV